MMVFDDDKFILCGELMLQIVLFFFDINFNGDVFVGWLVKQMDIVVVIMVGCIFQG